ncbi:MAG: DUF883 family protein [Wenzhouxiangella sp.]
MTTAKAKTTSKVTDKAHDAVDKVSDTLGEAEESIRSKAQDAQHKTEDLVKKVTDYVHDNPLTALGLAFAAGMVFSSVNRRR